MKCRYLDSTSYGFVAHMQLGWRMLECLYRLGL